jgi:proteasome lid subunit RPN8/RPN11
MNQSSGWRTANIKIRARHSDNSELVRPQPEVGNSFEVFVSADGSGAYIKRDVLAFIKQHAKLNGRNETIGLLCGRICRDPNKGPYTLVMAAGDAREGEFKSTPGDVRLLASGHTKLSRRLVNAHPDREIVGWYHTHPSYPPRFSSVDLSEQTTWTNPNHIGIVYSGDDKTEPFGVYRGPGATLLGPAADVTGKREDLAGREIDKRISPLPAPVPSKKGEPGPAAWPWLGHRRLLIAAVVILAGVCLLQAIGFFWLSRRVSTLERGLIKLVAAPPITDNSRERSPVPVSDTDKPTSPAISPSPEPVERVNRLSDPELHEPLKPLFPETKSQRPSQASRVAGPRAATARKQEKKKRAGSGGEKPKPPRREFSSPGERIVPGPTIRASPKP